LRCERSLSRENALWRGGLDLYTVSVPQLASIDQRAISLNTVCAVTVAILAFTFGILTVIMGYKLCQEKGQERRFTEDLGGEKR